MYKQRPRRPSGGLAAPGWLAISCLVRRGGAAARLGAPVQPHRGRRPRPDPVQSRCCRARFSAPCWPERASGSASPLARPGVRLPVGRGVVEALGAGSARGLPSIRPGGLSGVLRWCRQLQCFVKI